jgi:hypothetical protein
LRSAHVNLEGRLGPQTDCSTGTCWVIIEGDVDVAMTVMPTSDAPFVQYQSAIDGTWRQAGALPVWGAPLGYRRYHFVLNRDTFTAGPSSTVHLIPFVRTGAGGRAFDHNRVPDPLGAYTLSPDDNWTIQDDGSCAGAPPRGIETLVFAQGWQSSGSGRLVENGKLDISYDIYRIPSGLGCSTDGVEAFAVTAYMQVQPGGAITQERIDGPIDASGRFQSLPLELDVPSDATQVSLWFLDSSECRGNEWDSRYGANYVYAVSAP